MAIHLTPCERDRIAPLWYRGANQKEIARALGRSAVTICRELQRNRTGGNYYAAEAQQRAQRRRHDRPIGRKVDRAGINETVRHGLANDGSPEQIAGRLQLDHPDRRQAVPARTIYTWIANDAHREHWASRLRRRGRRPFRRKKRTESARRSKTVPKSSKRGRCWATLKATPCSAHPAHPARADW